MESRKRSASTEDGRGNTNSGEGSSSSSSTTSPVPAESGNPSKKQRRIRPSCNKTGIVTRASTGDIRNREIENIRTPQPNDVLCGRGGGTNNHVGNENFRVLVNKRKRDYLNSSKREKPLVSKAIVQEIREMDGRFLCKNDGTNSWYDIGDRKAREKTSQALREGAPEIRKELGVDDVKTRQEVLTGLINAVVNGTRIVNPCSSEVDDRRTLPHQEQRIWQRVQHVLPHAAHPTPVAPNYAVKGHQSPQQSHLQPPHSHYQQQPRPPFNNLPPPSGRTSFSSLATHPSLQQQHQQQQQQQHQQQQLPLQHQPHHRHPLLHTINYGHARQSVAAQQPPPRRGQHHHRHNIISVPPISAVQARIAQYPSPPQGPGYVPMNVFSAETTVPSPSVSNNNVAPAISSISAPPPLTTDQTYRHGNVSATAETFVSESSTTAQKRESPPLRTETGGTPPNEDGRLSRDVLNRLTVGDYLTRVACDGQEDTLDLEREAHLYQDAGIMGLDPQQVLTKDFSSTTAEKDALSDDTVKRVYSALESMGVTLPLTVIAGT